MKQYKIYIDYSFFTTLVGQRDIYMFAESNDFRIPTFIPENAENPFLDLNKKGGKIKWCKREHWDGLSFHKGFYHNEVL